MVKNGGNVIDAYGWVNVVSPAGLPVRSIIGISPDPIMFLAVNCADVALSEEFYTKLGLVRQVSIFVHMICSFDKNPSSHSCIHLELTHLI